MWSKQLGHKHCILADRGFVISLWPQVTLWYHEYQSLFFQGISSWWCHQMETFSTLLALCAGNSPVTGEFPKQRPVIRGFDVFFDLRRNKWLSKQSWGWRSETPSPSLWCHCNVFSDWQAFTLKGNFSQILPKEIWLHIWRQSYEISLTILFQRWQTFCPHFKL